MKQPETIGDLFNMPTGEGDWKDLPTIEEVEDWPGSVEDW